MTEREMFKFSLASLLNRAESATQVQLQAGLWRQLRVSLTNDRMLAHLDGQCLMQMAPSGCDQPTKTRYGVTVNGRSVDFDSLVVLSSNVDKSQ